MRTTLTVLAVALFGLFGAASLGYAAYVVSRDQVGLPVTKLQNPPGKLAPTPVKRVNPPAPKRVVPPPPPPPPSTTSREPGDDHGGRSRGGSGSSGSGGHGSDD
jgi:uncharacterized membrane protein YgcG